MVAAGGQPLGAAVGALIATVTTIRAAYATATGLLAATAVVAFVALRSSTPDRAARTEVSSGVNDRST